MDYQIRYVLYAKSKGFTPEECLKFDKKAHPGGRMAGYILWISSKISAFKKLKQIEVLSNVEHEEFDVWLAK